MTTKCTMQISVNHDSTYIENPSHVPREGEDVTIKIGNRSYSGVVIAVTHDFTVEGEQYISVTAR